MKRDYHARLTIYGLPEMKKPEYISQWLKNIAKAIKKNKKFSSIFIAKYMK